MKFLADENVPRQAVEALRAAGRDVAWVGEDDPSIPDTDVLSAAIAADRLIVTLDKDFGELLFGAASAPPPGVLFLRPGDLPPEEVTGRLFALLALGIPLRGHFVVDDGKRVRSRPLPAAGA